MGTAASNVNLTVTYKGIDQTAKAGKSARKSIKGIGKEAGKAKKQIASLRGGVSSLASGDLLGGLKQLRSTFGGGGGAMGIAAAAGAAAAGIVAVGVAAAAASVKITQITIETNRLVASADAAFGAKGGGGMQQALDIAEKVGGVGAENIIKLAAVLRSVGLSANITNKQMQELANRATTMGKTGDDALQAFADAIRTGSTEALSAVGTHIKLESVLSQYAKAHGMATDAITPHLRATIALETIQKSLNTTQGATNALYSKQDEALADLGNAYLKLKIAIAQAIGGEAADGVEILAHALSGMGALTRGIVNLMRVGLGPLRMAFHLASGAIATGMLLIHSATEGDLGAMRSFMQDFASETGKLTTKLADEILSIPAAFKTARAEMKVETDGIIFDASQTAALLEEYQARIARAQAKADAAAAKALAKRKAAAARWRQAVAAAGKAELAVMRERIKLNKIAGASEAVLFDSRIKLINAEEKAQIKAAKRARITKEGRVKALFAIEIAANAKRLKAQTVVNEEAAKAADKADKKAKEAADKRTASFKSAIAQAQALQGAIGGTQSTVGDLLVALPALGASAATALGKSETKMQDAMAIGQAAIMGIVNADGQRSIAAAKNEEERARAVEKAERKKAAILAIMETAKALAFAFTPGMQAQAASSAAAAVLYAGIAGGAIKTGSAGGGGMASTGSTTGGGGTMATGTADAAPSTGAINVNFGAGFVFGTKQQVGRAVAGSLRSLQTTGLATASGV